MRIKGQVAQLPPSEMRKVPRRAVNLAAVLREQGATTIEVDVLDLSTHGCRIAGAGALEPQTHVWLKLPGMEALFARIVWVEDGCAGCEFNSPIHRGAISLVIENNKAKQRPRRYGPDGRPVFGSA